MNRASSTPFLDQFQSTAIEFQILQMDFRTVQVKFRILQMNFRSLPLIEHQISKTPLSCTLLCIPVRSQEYSRYHLLKYYEVMRLRGLKLRSVPWSGTAWWISNLRWLEASVDLICVLISRSDYSCITFA